MPENNERTFALSDPCMDSEDNPRIIALKGLCRHYFTQSKTLELLHDRIINDPNEQLRQWAQEQLEKLKVNNESLETKG